MNTRELFESVPGLDSNTRSLLLSVVSTRGKWKDSLLASAPSQRTDPARWATWQAVISFLAPSRCSMYSMMLMSDLETQIFNKVDDALKARVPGTNFGLFMFLQAVEPGFRWNLFAYHNDTDGIQKYYQERVSKQG